MIDGFSNPAAFWLAALAAPIVALYMLKTRRTKKVVSSTFLWEKTTANLAASSPWQRLKPTTLLLLQLLLLFLMILALAGPFRSAPGIGGKHLVLLVDTSGSMLATESGASRLEEAKMEALDLIETLEPGAVGSVIAAGPRPRVLVSSVQDKGSLRRAVHRLSAGHGAADFAEAFLLSESLETPSRPATIVLVSDGVMSEADEKLVPPGTVFRQVGKRADNVGIRRLDVGEGAGEFKAFVTIGNSFRTTRPVELNLELDGRPIASHRMTVPPGGSAEKSLDIGAQTGRLVASIQADDHLAADNRAFGVLQRTRPSRILLATPGNVFLETLLRQLPGASVDVTDTAPDGLGYDLAVYDRVAAPAEPQAPALFVSPLKPPKGVVVKGEVANPAITYLSPEDPLLDQVDLSELAIARTKAVEIANSRTLVGSEGTPLVGTWTDGSLRRVWLGFDLHDSNLPVQVAFPILGDHLLGWLTGATRAPAKYAGEPVVPSGIAGIDEITAKVPGGRMVQLNPQETLSETDAAGFYELEYVREARPIRTETVALSFPPSEQELAPREVAASAEGARPGLVDTARRPAVGLIGLLLLSLVLLEWWWGHGRPVPGRLTTAP